MSYWLAAEGRLQRGVQAVQAVQAVQWTHATIEVAHFGSNKI